MIVFVFVKVLGTCHLSMCHCHCFVKVLWIHPASLWCGNDWRLLRERRETMMWQWCDNDVTMMWQWCGNDVAMMWQWCGNDFRLLRERGETRKLNSPARPQSQRRGFIHGINGILGQRNQFKKGSSFFVCNHRKGASFMKLSVFEGKGIKRELLKLCSNLGF